eukprot:1592493-Pyramimonas_sp.AAC.1
MVPVQGLEPTPAAHGRLRQRPFGGFYAPGGARWVPRVRPRPIRFHKSCEPMRTKSPSVTKRPLPSEPEQCSQRLDARGSNPSN